MASGLSDTSDCIGQLQALRYPESGSECSRPANTALTVNDRLRPARIADQAQEMLELSDGRRAEVLYRDVVASEAQRHCACNIVSRRLLVFLQERDQHLEPVAPQLFEVCEG